MPPREQPIPKKVEPVIVRRITPQGKIVEELRYPINQPPSPLKKTPRPELKIVPPPLPEEESELPPQNLIRRVRKTGAGETGETVFEIDRKTGKPQKVLVDEVRQFPAAPAPELAPQPVTPEVANIDVDFTKLYEKEISRVNNWGGFISALEKIGQIKDNDGTIYAAEYFITIARHLQTVTADNYPTIDSPLVQSIPETYGIRQKFQELLKTTKPLTKAEDVGLVFPTAKETKPQPLKPLPADQREVEPLPVFQRPDLAQREAAPLPEAPPLEIELIPTREPIEETNYQSAAEYQDLSDNLNKRADALLGELHTWNIEEHDRQATPAEIIRSPYYKEFANTREQARLAAQLSDRQALYGMLKQEFSEIEDDLTHDSAMDRKHVILASARVAEIKHEMSRVHDDITRLDNHFLALDVDNHIQSQKKIGFTPEEQRAMNNLAQTYEALNRAQERLDQEKSGFLNGFKAFFSKEKKERVKAAEELVRAYSHRLAVLSEEAVVARKAQKARISKKLQDAKI